MRIACWNAEWHRATSWKGSAIRDRLLATDAEIVCCPEAHEDFFADGWHGVFSRPDTGYPIKSGRRKVTLWSRQPWETVDDFGSADLPPGRFVRATTTTSLGPVDVVGICVPWSASHVSDGRRDRQRWEDHLLYLRALRPLLEVRGNNPVIVIGDLNQAVPRRRAPIRAYDELLSALGDIEIWTKGQIAGLDAFPVCHVAGTSRFTAAAVEGFSRWHDGKPLSDHDGIAVDVRLS